MSVQRAQNNLNSLRWFPIVFDRNHEVKELKILVAVLIAPWRIVPIEVRGQPDMIYGYDLHTLPSPEKHYLLYISCISQLYKSLMRFLCNKKPWPRVVPVTDPSSEIRAPGWGNKCVG